MCDIVRKLDDTIERVIEDKLSEVKEELLEKESRKSNIIIYGVPEANNSDRETRLAHEKNKIKEITDEIAVTDINVVDSFRLGRYDPSKKGPRPLKIKLESHHQQLNVLKAARLLSSSKIENMKKIYIKKDLTQKERQDYQKLREALKAREAKGETDLIIINGQIVKKRKLPPRLEAAAAMLH